MIKKVYYLNLFLIFLLFSFTVLEKDKFFAFQEISKNVENRSMAYANLSEATASIGHRLTGSTNGKKAEQFAFEKFKDAGYKNTEYLPFEASSWSREQITLHIVPKNSDNFREVEVVSLAHSPISAHISAHIIDCKDGLESDFEEVSEQVRGQIAMFNVNIQLAKNKGQKNLHRSEKTALAIKHGAAGVILVNQVKGGVLLTGTASVTGELIDIPAVCVSFESGLAIRKWIYDEKDILGEIDMLNHFEPVRSRNVKALHKGNSKYTNQKIIVGAHLDSWDLAQGAIDNGIGAFSVIDIARVFNELKLKTKRPIEFVLFMGEEQGLLGSKEYVKRLQETREIENVALMINLDMLNDCQGFNAFGDAKMKKLIDKFGAEINKFDANYKDKNSNNAALHSDHQPFMTAGIPICVPTGRLSAAALDCYHADCDSFDLVDEQELKNNVKYTAMMLYQLANVNKLPARKTSIETRDYLTAQNLKQELILGNEWLWKD